MLGMEAKQHSLDSWKRAVAKVLAAEMALSSADETRRMADLEYCSSRRELKKLRDQRNELIIADSRNTVEVALLASLTRGRCAQIRLETDRGRSAVITEDQWKAAVEKCSAANAHMALARRERDSANLAYSLAVGALQRAKDGRDEMIVSDPRGDVEVSGYAGISRSWCSQIRSAYRERQALERSA